MKTYQAECNECGDSFTTDDKSIQGSRCEDSNEHPDGQECPGEMQIVDSWTSATKPRVPLRKRIKWALAHKKLPRTAQWFKSHPGIEPYAGIGTVSSLLKKMVDDGDLLGIDNYGPLGGRGYKLNRRK